MLLHISVKVSTNDVNLPFQDEDIRCKGKIKKGGLDLVSQIQDCHEDITGVQISASSENTTEYFV